MRGIVLAAAVAVACTGSAGEAETKGDAGGGAGRSGDTPMATITSGGADKDESSFELTQPVGSLGACTSGLTDGTLDVSDMVIENVAAVGYGDMSKYEVDMTWTCGSIGTTITRPQGYRFAMSHIGAPAHRS